MQTWHLIYKLYYALRYFESIMKVMKNHNEQCIHLIFKIIKKSSSIFFLKIKPWYKIPIYWAKLNVPHLHLIQQSHILDNVQLGILQNKSFHCTICFIWKKPPFNINFKAYLWKKVWLLSNIIKFVAIFCLIAVRSACVMLITDCPLRYRSANYI